VACAGCVCLVLLCVAFAGYVWLVLDAFGTHAMEWVGGDCSRPMCGLTDLGKWDRPPLLHVCHQAVDQFAAANGGALPKPGNKVSIFCWTNLV
jgi:hypothetical protein